MCPNDSRRADGRSHWSHLGYRRTCHGIWSVVVTVVGWWNAAQPRAGIDLARHARQPQQRQRYGTTLRATRLCARANVCARWRSAPAAGGRRLARMGRLPAACYHEWKTMTKEGRQRREGHRLPAHYPSPRLYYLPTEGALAAVRVPWGAHLPLRPPCPHARLPLARSTRMPHQHTPRGTAYTYHAHLL